MEAVPAAPVSNDVLFVLATTAHRYMQENKPYAAHAQWQMARDVYKARRQSGLKPCSVEQACATRRKLVEVSLYLTRVERELGHRLNLEGSNPYEEGASLEGTHMKIYGVDCTVT